jgi:hypothetical protein
LRWTGPMDGFVALAARLDAAASTSSGRPEPVEGRG